MIVLEETTTKLHLQFESLHDLGTYVQEHGEAVNYNAKTHTMCPMKYQQTIDVAINGGADGYDGTFKSLELPDIGREQHIPQPFASQHGYRPNVAAYLANEPNCMYRTEMQSTQSNTVKVGVHIGRDSFVEEHDAAERGRAVVAMIDALQRAGKSVEVWAAWHNYYDGKCVWVDILLKPANAVWDSASVSFTLINTAVQRRLIWMVGAIYRELGNLAAKTVVDNGCGNGIPATGDDFDIWVPYQRNRHQDQWSAKNVRQTIQNLMS